MRIPYRPGLWPWLLQRLSAAFLIVGLAGHFLAVHFLVNKEKLLGFRDIAARMATPCCSSAACTTG